MLRHSCSVCVCCGRPLCTCRASYQHRRFHCLVALFAIWCMPGTCIKGAVQCRAHPCTVHVVSHAMQHSWLAMLSLVLLFCWGRPLASLGCAVAVIDAGCQFAALLGMSCISTLSEEH